MTRPLLRDVLEFLLYAVVYLVIGAALFVLLGLMLCPARWHWS